MARSGRFSAEPLPARKTAHGPLTDAQLRAYLAAREAMRQLKPSGGPCFARNWRPPGWMSAQRSQAAPDGKRSEDAEPVARSQ